MSEWKPAAFNEEAYEEIKRRRGVHRTEAIAMSDHNNNDGEGQYWWVLPLIGFLAITGILMAETAFLAAMP